MTKKQKLLNQLYKQYAKPSDIPLDTSGATQIVWGYGNPDAKLMIIGEAPGKDEDLQGKPFVGRSGKLLTQALKECGIERDQIFITNTVKCRPPNNRAPKPDEIAFYKKTFLEHEITIIKPTVILTLGATALKTLDPDAKEITKVHGTSIPKDSYILIPTYHPAYILRNRSRYKDFVHDICLAFERAQR